MIEVPQVYGHLTESEKKAELYKQHSDTYYSSNFNLENGIIRRRPIGIVETDTGFNNNEETGYLRHIELIKVLKYYTKEIKMNFSNFKGEHKQYPVHEWNEETFCCCGENSSLYICEHIGTGKKFYLGSSCIKKFDPTFDEERGAGLKYGLCVECETPLRCRTNKKKDLRSNYSQLKSDSICFDCENKKEVERLEEERNKRKIIEQERIRIEIEVKKKMLEKVEQEKQKQKELKKQKEMEMIELEKRKKFKLVYVPFGDDIYSKMINDINTILNEGRGIYKVKVVDGILPDWLCDYKIIKLKYDDNEKERQIRWCEGVKLIYYNGYHITNKKLGSKLIPN